MDNADYGQLRLLHAIAREGNISAAARTLGITAPSASHALKLLEQKTGVPLFTRTTRQIHPTEAGELLLSRTRDALEAIEQAFADVAEQQNEPKGYVRINTSRVAYQMLLQPKLAEFCQQYPHITPEICIDDGITDLVAQGFDVGIRFGNTLSEGVVARQLTAPIKLGLYASAAYLAQHGTPQTPQDLTQHRFLYYRYHSSKQISPLVLQENNQEFQLDVRESFVSNDIDVLLDMARAGVGITRTFEPIIQQLPQPHDLQAVLPDYWQIFPPLYLYYRQHAQKARRVQALVAFLLRDADFQAA